jgi:hypothetical protein
MKTSARPQVRWFAAAAVVCASVPAVAAGLTVQVTLPGFTTANAYRPYLAAWVEQAADNTPVGTLAVWYDVKLRDGLGKSWLRVPFEWGGEPNAAQAEGSKELGKVLVTVGG